MHEMKLLKHPSDDDCTLLYIYEIAFDAEIQFQTFSFLAKLETDIFMNLAAKKLQFTDNLF